LESRLFLFLKHAVDFYHDRDYFRLLVKFALPIALQSLITSLLNMVGVIMIGQLGAASIAAVGLANQVWFLLNLLIFGIVSGCAMFMAQLWGKKDIPNVRRVLGLAVKLGLLGALVFWSLATLFPSAILHLYTEDKTVIELGSQYLQIYSWSFGFYAISTAYGASLRSTGFIRLPLVVSTAALGFNILISFPFIFGWHTIGLPAQGVNGAAIAGLIARVLECLAMLGTVYMGQINPSAASLRDLLELDLKFFLSVLKPVLPVITNEFLWSMGVTTYSAIYAHIGTNAIAAINIIGTVDQLVFVLFLGIGSATAIMVGNLIGQGENERAFLYAGRSLGIEIIGSAIMGMFVFLFAGNFLHFFKVSPEVISDANKILVVLASGMTVRSANYLIIIGVLRSGGDTRFSLFLDGIIIWLVGVPATAAGAFLFHLPVWFVYALTLTEEFTKFVLGLARYFSRKWINDLTQKVSGGA
jgi:putative MATE family efflux protein